MLNHQKLRNEIKRYIEKISHNIASGLPDDTVDKLAMNYRYQTGMVEALRMIDEWLIEDEKKSFDEEDGA